MRPDHLSDLRFSDLGLHPSLLTGLQQLGFEYCTPIQAAALPRALAGEDLAGQAQTGTGKSAAFLLATMQHGAPTGCTGSCGSASFCGREAQLWQSGQPRLRKLSGQLRASDLQALCSFALTSWAGSSSLSGWLFGMSSNG